MAERTPRRLFISTRPVWPLDAGYVLRTNALLCALARLGPCDAILVAPGGDARTLPPQLSDSVGLEVLDVPRRSVTGSLRAWVGGAPRGWARVDWAHARSSIGRAVTSGAYDTVVASGIDVWEALDEVTRARVVIDIDDLETGKIDHRVANGRLAYRGVAGRIQQLSDRVDRRRWAKIEHDVVTASRHVIVCSAHDRELLADPKVHAVPNPYPPATEKVVRSVRPRTISFIGTLGTPPNREACKLLVDAIMPQVWRRDPSVQLRLVGRAPFHVDASNPRVVMTGFVDDLGSEYARAGVVVAPFLSGGGTRIKILEAFRAGVPVVATSIGIEGIGAIDGVHALVRDDPQAFAEACVYLLDNDDLAQPLAGAALEFVEAHHSPDAIVRALEDAIKGIRCRA